MPALVPPCSRTLPGLSPAWQHGHGLSSLGTANTSQTWRIRHFGCRESHAKAISFYCRSAPSDHPLGLPPPSVMHWGGLVCSGGRVLWHRGYGNERVSLNPAAAAGPGLLVQGIWQLGQQSPGLFWGGLAAPRGGKGPT